MGGKRSFKRVKDWDVRCGYLVDGEAQEQKKEYDLICADLVAAVSSEETA